MADQSLTSGRAMAPKRDGVAAPGGTARHSAGGMPRIGLIEAAGARASVDVLHEAPNPPARGETTRPDHGIPGPGGMDAASNVAPFPRAFEARPDTADFEREREERALALVKAFWPRAKPPSVDHAATPGTAPADAATPHAAMSDGAT